MDLNINTWDVSHWKCNFLPVWTLIRHPRSLTSCEMRLNNNFKAPKIKVKGALIQSNGMCYVPYWYIVDNSYSDFNNSQLLEKATQNTARPGHLKDSIKALASFEVQCFSMVFITTTDFISCVSIILYTCTTILLGGKTCESVFTC